MRRSRHLAKPDACEFALPVRAHSHRFSLARTVLGRQRGDKFFETRITAEHIPVGTFLQFAIGNPGWKFDGFLQLFQRQVPIAAPGVNCRQIGYPDGPDPGVLGKGKDLKQPIHRPPEKRRLCSAKSRRSET